MKTYYDDLASNELLSAQEERALAERIAEGDAEARDRLVRANLRLVVSLARHFIGRGVPHEDLVAEGNLGLLRAAEGYDGRSSVRFATYASFWIKQSIRRTVINNGRFIRLPQYTVALVAKWRRAEAELAEEFGRAPTNEEISSALSLSRSKRRIVREVLHAASLTPYNAAEGEYVVDSIASGGLCPDAAVANTEEMAWLLAGLERLEPREAAILRLRFGIDSEEPLTYAEIGRRLGLTREWVRKLERRALDQLMNASQEVVATTVTN